MKRLWGTPLGVIGAYSGPSGRLLSRRLLPIVVLVRCCSVQDAESYTWPERVLLLDSVTTVVPIGHSRSTSSRGGVVSVFARGKRVVLRYLRQVGVVPILSCMKNIELWCVGAA